MKEYINVLTGKRIKIDINLLPDSFVKNLKEIETTEKPIIIKERKNGKGKIVES